ncbi:hypothetical protein H0H81_004380, partial [Sphagnurus paluster]
IAVNNTRVCTNYINENTTRQIQTALSRIINALEDAYKVEKNRSLGPLLVVVHLPSTLLHRPRHPERRRLFRTIYAQPHLDFYVSALFLPTARALQLVRLYMQLTPVDLNDLLFKEEDVHGLLLKQAPYWA